MEKRIKFDMFIPEDVKKINDIFTEKEYELFPVGGCVRDAYLKVKPKDYDLATNAIPDAIITLLKEKSFVKNILLTGKNFGVINIITNSGNEYEIATFRSDGIYNDGRRPDSVIFSNITSDANRRDLRINALYYDLNTNEIIDIVGGIDDIDNKIIRAVGDPKERFIEDSLRVLRAIRFAARFDSNLEFETDAAIKQGLFNLNNISKERIRDEFLKGIKTAVSTVHFLKLIDEYDLWFWIFPNLSIDKNFAEEKDHVVLIANLLKGNDLIKIDKILRKMTFTVNKGKDINSVKEIPKIKFLISFLDFDTSKVRDFKDSQLKAGVSEDQIRKFSKLTNLDSKIVNTFIDFNNTITGQELMDLGFSGRSIRDEQDRLEANNFKTFLRK